MSSSIIREQHGIANARKVASARAADSDLQCVTVTDGRGEVLLMIGEALYPAGLTPTQACMLADQLVASAQRVSEAREEGKPA